MKTCTRCKVAKPLSEYHKHAKQPDGLQKQCKMCRKTVASNKHSTITRVTEITITEKQCRKCKITKQVAEFHKAARQSDGLNTWCKVCKSQAARVTSKRNKEKAKVLVKHKRCPGCDTVKAPSEFPVSRDKRDGLGSWCKECGKRNSRSYEKRMNSRDIPTDFRDTMKTCSRCKRELPGTSFSLSKGKKEFLTSHCKDCFSERKQEVYKYLDIKKREMGGCCVECGIKTLNVLEFDHLRDKKCSVTYMNSIKSIDSESAKCQLLCMWCHRKKSARDRYLRYLDHCKENESYRNRKTKLDYVESVKRTIGSCQCCGLEIQGNKFDTAAFDFHHLDPTEKVTDISRMCMNKYSIARIDAEIDKCTLVCCVCHKYIEQDLKRENESI